ncbi:hypothetical protein [Actinocorallia populi]|uniref:hypothetical protein n=1 Tax=Actinocorallia populi TaxID=2079200 RepID=UPI0013007B0E|nr:hypothetical protein [Actinocorallia populi]
MSRSKLLLPLVLVTALAPVAPSHAAPASPFKVLKKVDGVASRIIMTGAKSGFAFFVGGEPQKPLAYRWNGRTWRSTPLPGGFDDALNLEVEAAASGPSNVWTLMSTHDGNYGEARSRVVRWDGRRWSKARSFPGMLLEQIAVTGGKDVWVFGTDTRAKKDKAWHYDGRAWRAKTVPGPQASHLMVRSGAGRIWAIDWFSGRRLFRWTGTRWKAVKVTLPGGASRWETTSLDVQGERVTVGFSTKRSTEDGTPLSGESRIVSGNGHRWRVEKPGPARPKVLQVAVPDGRGGMWALGSDPAGFNEPDRLYHRTAKGRWKTRALPYGNLNTRPDDLTRLPGSTRLIGVAGTYLVHEYGRIITTR